MMQCYMRPRNTARWNTAQRPEDSHLEHEVLLTSERSSSGRDQSTVEGKIEGATIPKITKTAAKAVLTMHEHEGIQYTYMSNI